MSETYRGSCLCGAIRYELKGVGPYIANCHCSMCRKFHGAAYATIAGVASADFRWTQGEQYLQAYTADNGTTRQFCRHCGSSMTFSSPQASGDVIEFSLGTLDSPLDVGPDAHIFVGSKANWEVISDSLPQYQEGRSSKRLK